MHTDGHRLRRAGVSVFICLYLWLPFPSALAATPQFDADCKELTRGAHRLAGTAEGRAAVVYIEKRLREIGPDHVVVEEFPTAQTAIRRCVIEVRHAGDLLGQAVPGEKRELKLLPIRPNGIIPPVTPPEGITGEIIHAGAGSASEFKKSPRGRIVVLDYNCDRGWLRAFRLGARAVVFVRPQEKSEDRRGKNEDGRLSSQAVPGPPR